MNPKKRKRGRKPRRECEAEVFKEERDDDDVDPEELIENQQLIELVKEHPVLYDKYKIRDSKNLTLKNDAWHDISESMGISEEICYKRWKKLRDRFAREYRHQKIYPERSVTWVYFQDLSFLEDHYRKGIPLPVDTIRQRKKMKATTASTDETWVDDCPFLYVKDGHHSHDEDIDDIDPAFSEVNSNSLDELIIMPKSNDSFNDIVIDESITPPGNTSQSSFQMSEGTNLEEPEQKLSVVISGIQQVLEQSQECLKTLQKQKEQQKQQMQSDVSLSINAEVSMIQKVHILLDGLNLPNRTLAERRIVQFLCECQIKTLNNVDIEDVDGTEDY
uniref:Transcription factor Adf-1 n=1 Tax=Bactrocera latifrons TaxID=174628 RepID=A0A0K8VZS6_BACLA